MKKKKKIAKPICMYANREEVAKLEKVKRYYQRTTTSDLLRFLINQAYEKILNKNIAGKINNTESAI